MFAGRRFHSAYVYMSAPAGKDHKAATKRFLSMCCDVRPGRSAEGEVDPEKGGGAPDAGGGQTKSSNHT